MPVNKDLLVEVMAQIETHPETWDQAHWAQATDCGTTACFAGWAVQLAGATLIRDGGRHFYLCSTPEGKKEHIAEYAERVLGLPEDHALFAASNTMDDLRAFVKGLLNDEPVHGQEWQIKNISWGPRVYKDGEDL